MARRGDKSYVRIIGLDEFIRDLNVLPGQVKQAERIFEATAATTVAIRAKARARSGDSIQANSATDVRVGGHGTVVYGGQGYSMGAEFGAYRYKQFQVWRGNADDAGYFLWPSIREFRNDAMLELWSHEVWRVVQKVFT